MADPLTALGAAAAAAQVADQAYRLIKFFSNLYGKIKEAPELTRTRVAHLEQLQTVSKLIERTKPLQTSEVQAILVALKAVHKEDKVIVLLDRIEKHKSLLALCIHQLDAAQLELLNIEVSEVRTTLGEAAIVINDTAAHVQTLIDIAPAMADQVQELFENIPGVLGRIQDDLKIAVSSHLSASAKASHSGNPVSRRDFETAVKRFVNMRFLVWSSILFAVFAVVRFIFLEQTGRPDETSLLPYKLYEVPSKRVKNFVGREETLHRIRAGLSSPKRNPTTMFTDIGPNIVVIKAMGGQGKTQVALEYCRLWRNASDIFWVDATSESTVKANFALLSYVVDPSTNSSAWETEAKVVNTRRALADWKLPWLMVFDNYDDPKSYNIRKYIPENKLGMVIFTTRHKDVEFLAEPANRIKLAGLNQKEAIQLLLLESELNDSSNISIEHAAAIVSRLAYHPLVVAQAGAYINMRNLDLGQFIDAYNEKQGAILKETTPLMSGYWKRVNESSQEIPMSVFTTCELSFQQLLDLEKGEERNVPDLLTILAFFGSQEIPEALFKAFFLSEGQLHRVAANVTLCTQNMEVSANSNPPLMASLAPFKNSGFILDQQEESTRMRLSEPASAVPFNGPGSFLRQQEEGWDQSSFHEVLRVLRQLSLAELSLPSHKNKPLHVSLHPVIRDWLRLRTPKDQCLEYSRLAATCIYKYLASTQDWAAYQMTLPERQQLIGHIHAFAANIAEFGTGQVPEAFNIRVYDEGQNTGRVAYEFSKLLYQNGKYEEAVEWARRSLAQRVKHFGSEAPETLEAQASLAGALYLRNEYRSEDKQEAERIYLHIIDVQNRTLGPDHPETILSNVNLAPLLTNKGGYVAAEGIYRSALAFYNTTLGKSDPNTIIMMGALGYLLTMFESSKEWNDVAGIYEANYTEAEELNRQALKLATIVFGASHQRTLAIMDFLGITLSKLGQLEEAEVVLREALRVREIEFGRGHPDTIRCMRRLVPILRERGKDAEATEIRVRFFGEQGVLDRSFNRGLIFALYEREPFLAHRDVISKAVDPYTVKTPL